MILDVLVESWVVKLCRVIAAGRQIAARQEIQIYGRSSSNIV